MIAESFDWPHPIVRVVTLGLVVALAVVVLLAWYHGRKARHCFSTAELSMLAVLLLVAGTVMWGFTRVRAPAERPSAVFRMRTLLSMLDMFIRLESGSRSLHGLSLVCLASAVLSRKRTSM